MTTTGDPVTEPVEHRLALVMNGGVSLAVWMGGVAREIDNARRASNGLPLPADASETETITYDLWVKATEKAGATVTVDVIAGTSAGGLNGVLLAASIARGAPMSRWLRDLWVELGQLSDDALFLPQAEPQSLMNGDFFHDQIKKALDKMTAAPEEQRGDVSLIVTATALGPSARPVRDTAGRRFGESDHRRRFHFSRHPSRATYAKSGAGYQLGTGDAADHFTTSEPLATAARATASFPAAFKPVPETEELRRRRVWPDWTTSTKLDWLADGGILDNSPFGPILESIQHKPVDGSWKRTVCYIDPAADEPTPTGVGHVHQPGAGPDGPGGPDAVESLPPSWLSVGLSAVSLPREADFRDDIEQLHETIRTGRSSLEVRRFLSLTEGADAARDLAIARQICAPGITLYRQSCLSTAIYETRDVLARARDGYLTPAHDVPIGADPGLPLYPPPRSWLPVQVPASGDPLPTTWDWGAAAATRVLRILLRSARTTGTGPGAGTSLRAQLSQAVDQATAIAWALDEFLAGSAGGATAPELSDVQIVDLLDNAYQALGAPGQLAEIVSSAVTAYAQSAHVRDSDVQVTAVDALTAALAIEVSNGAASLPATSARPIFDFDRLGLDRPPPLVAGEYDAALNPPSGPNDPPGSPPSANNIVYGSRLNHFAGFAIEDWRRWDWLWGRLNALAHLAQLLSLGQAEVDQLTLAIMDDEGTDLTAVRERIGVVMALTPAEINKAVETSGDLPAAIDSALALLRSNPDTNPRLPSLLVHTGQVASDVLARNGHEGDVEHHALRAGAALFRDGFWRRLRRRE
jgi:patatin-related protein